MRIRRLRQIRCRIADWVGRIVIAGILSEHEFMKLLVALFAALTLVVLDSFFINVLFLYRPTGGEILAVVMLAGGLGAVALRWRWLFIATQNAMTALIVVRLLQWEGPAEASDVGGAAFSVFLVVGLGNVLAWLVTRAIPRRQPR